MSEFCPPDRNALKEFYDYAKGQEWSNSKNWIDEYKLPCNHWYGVTCDNLTSSITELNLTNNGLSGILDTRIGTLTSLKVLDLSDNDIKGSIPSEVGMLSNLEKLRISYNAFTGEIPETLVHLQELGLVHLHGNRLIGDMPKLTSKWIDESCFIADCGVPSDFEEPLSCPECTMCCNSAGEFAFFASIDHCLRLNQICILNRFFYLDCSKNKKIVILSTKSDPFQRRLPVN